MKIADFHNDILTSKGFDCLPKDYGEHKIVTAIYKGNMTFDSALTLADKSKYIAFEDVGYDDLNEDKLLGKSPIYVGLTWNDENQFGYGCDYSFGLKNKGIE